MSDVKANVEEVLNRLSEVLDVLKRITEDLQDISKSLKTMIPAFHCRIIITITPFTHTANEPMSFQQLLIGM